MEEIKNKKQVEDLLEETRKSGEDIREMTKHIKIAPSKRKILQMPKEILLKHNALICHKGSTLSSTQRKMVMDRIAYGINKGLIKYEDVAYEINKLNALIQGELIKTIKNNDSTIVESGESIEKA